MNNRLKNRTRVTDPKKQLQNMGRLVTKNQKLEKKNMLVSKNNESLKKRILHLKHDIRNPLSGITGLLDLLIIEDKDQFEVNTSDMITIKESAQSVLDLVNNTLVTDAAEIGLHENMNVDRLLTSAIMDINNLYLPMAQNKSVALSLSAQIDTEILLPPNFYISLIQITGNLVANAIKFTPSNGFVDVVFNLDTDESQNILNIIVSDTGTGMTSEQVSAFNNGKPIDKSTGTNGEKGFGIGLQHIINTVSELKGHVFVKNEKKSGTTFSLSIPLPDQISPLKNTTHFIVENGTVSLNGYQS